LPVVRETNTVIHLGQPSAADVAPAGAAGGALAGRPRKFQPAAAG